MKKIRQRVCIVMPIVILLICAFGFLLAPNDPNYIDLTKKFTACCKEYPLGTDQFGRCILSRILYGGKTTLGIILVGAMTTTILGTLCGLLLGKSSYRHNIVIESLLNAVTAIPPIAYLIIFIGAWGNGITTMVIALTVSLLLRLIKLVKTRTEIELGKAYVMCAIASGASKLHITFVHVGINVIRDVLHFICLSCADMILAITGFSFIGLGLGDEVIDWGMMISEARSVIVMHPQIMLYPIVCILICTFSFNLLGREIEKGGE